MIIYNDSSLKLHRASEKKITDIRKNVFYGATPNRLIFWECAEENGNVIEEEEEEEEE